MELLSGIGIIILTFFGFSALDFEKNSAEIKVETSKKINNNIIDNNRTSQHRVLTLGKKNIFFKDYLLFPYYKNQYLASKNIDLIKRNIFKIKTSEKKVYLTFDDGPNKKSTIEYFKKNNIAATFFLICNKIKEKNIQKYDDILFSIGAHTFSHRNYDRLNKNELFEDILKCDEIFKQNSLKLTKFRTAFGIINKDTLDILEEKNIQNYLWNIDSYDRNKGFTKERAKIMVENTKGGDIILFHESLDLNMLDFYIKLLEKKGFYFGKL